MYDPPYPAAQAEHRDLRDQHRDAAPRRPEHRLARLPGDEERDGDEQRSPRAARPATGRRPASRATSARNACQSGKAYPGWSPPSVNSSTARSDSPPKSASFRTRARWKSRPRRSGAPVIAQSAIPSTAPAATTRSADLCTARKRPVERSLERNRATRRTSRASAPAAISASRTSASASEACTTNTTAIAANSAASVQASAAENRRTRSARARSAPGRSTHASPRRAAPRARAGVRQQPRDPEQGQRDELPREAAHHSQRAASRYMRPRSPRKSTPRSRSATISSRRACAASRGPRCFARTSARGRGRSR